MTVAIVGGGIAGLAMGCALALRGIRSRIFEQARELTEVGAGLQISPNGWRVLQGLGLADALAPTVFEPPEISLRLGQSGRLVWTTPMGPAARDRWGAPYMLVHRADLANALRTRFEDLVPGGLAIAAQVTGYDQGLHFADGTSTPTSIVIGADGLNSTIRLQMLGPEKPRYTGNLAWRALVPVEALGNASPDPNVTVWAGNERHVVTTRIRAGRVVNFVGMVEAPEPSEEGWRIKGAATEVLPFFANWAPEVTRTIKAASTLHRWALFERQPLAKWSDDQAVLIGDAAHPMLPSLAQGAVQALEDAWVLAALLAGGADVGEAGTLLYQERVARTSRIQKVAAENARMFHRAGPWMTPIYYGGMGVVTRLAPQLVMRRQDWIYNEDVVSQYPLS